MKKRTKQFIKGLRHLEQSGEVDKLTGIFSEKAKLFNAMTEVRCEGSKQAKEYWTKYSSLFKDIESNFHHVTESDSTSVLEWQATGHLGNGQPINYQGVSCLEFDEDGCISDFRTYYDSAEFLRPKEGKLDSQSW